MNRRQYRNRWLRRHKEYERIAYKELIKGFKELGNSIPWQFMTVENFEFILESDFDRLRFFNIYQNVYSKIGLLHGKRVGKEINNQIKEFTFDVFSSDFSRNLLTWLFNNVTERVVSVRSVYLTHLRNLIVEMVNDNMTMPEIARELQKRINQRGFYRWQALRIARTETTAAANYSATQAGRISGVVYEKVWISAVDSRTRRLPKAQFDHRAMNGVRVDADSMFEVPTKGGFELLAYPGDPKGSAGNVINCRCTTAIVPKRDSNGRVVRNS